MDFVAFSAGFAPFSNGVASNATLLTVPYEMKTPLTRNYVYIPK